MRSCRCALGEAHGHDYILCSSAGLLVVHDPARERAGYSLKVKRGKRETVERFQTESRRAPGGAGAGAARPSRHVRRDAGGRARTSQSHVRQPALRHSCQLRGEPINLDFLKE